MFVQEQELYQKEGLGVNEVHYVDNQDCIGKFHFVILSHNTLCASILFLCGQSLWKGLWFIWRMWDTYYKEKDKCKCLWTHRLQKLIWSLTWAGFKWSKSKVYTCRSVYSVSVWDQVPCMTLVASLRWSFDCLCCKVQNTLTQTWPTCHKCAEAGLSVRSAHPHDTCLNLSLCSKLLVREAKLPLSGGPKIWLLIIQEAGISMCLKGESIMRICEFYRHFCATRSRRHDIPSVLLCLCSNESPY